MTNSSDVPLRRISGEHAHWIMLGDAFLYVWKAMNIDTTAKLALGRKLAEREIRSQAATLRSSSLSPEKVGQKSGTIELPGEFWRVDRVKIDWERNSAISRGVDPTVIEHANVIEVWREDLFRIWPPQIKTKGTTRPLMKRVTDEALEKFLRTLARDTVEKTARDDANEHFSGYQKKFR
jgi:hypothetical protein